MPPFTALLHTANDALRLGRALEMLVPCDEILIVDHDSTDGTRLIARAYGARLVPPEGRDTGHYLEFARHDWILCLNATESITEALQATLYEWKLSAPDNLAAAFSIFVREETSSGWLEHPLPETRLVPRHWQRWHGRLPASEPLAVVLEGEILRFALP